ncbi:hypothetical protein SEVIR_2G245500v4 [Setaria viridis]|uniref:ubiquitinyl hydrolase 1 n=1 Tax=Setaria viridis TaxID=4556 RepID=A0A4U6VUE4_SETVI|nr:ubiquitin carboxyl-terminal hydrolase 17-like [Setaria viridis]TKW33560.1 hypothetical protein SEVIR_2G245500v2 [Setaria viridis]
MELSTAVALVVAVALMALGMAATGWLQRVEARRLEVRRLAWQAAEEVEIAEREEAYYYGQYGGEFVSASDVPEAPPLWAAPEVDPSPKEAVVEDEVAVAASTPPGKGVCAMCARPTTLRCKRCKSVKYCTFKCQIDHWRKGHKDECHTRNLGARQDGAPENVVTRVEVKDMPPDKPSNTAEVPAEYSQFTGKAESVDCSRLTTSSNAAKVHDTAVCEKNYLTTPDQHTELESELEQSNKQALGADNHESSRNSPCMSAVDKVSSAHSSAYCLSHNPSKRGDNSHGLCARSESSRVMPNNPSTEKKYARQQTAIKVVRHYATELALFPYKHFIELYNFEKLELHPFGLCNLGNSCYANAVLQCLAFTRPLTAYLLEGYHSRNCSKMEWCFMCELEKVMTEGKCGKAPVSPTGILSHLNEIGTSFGQGREEDAHEFLRYAIDTMQSASVKEAKKNGVHKLAEESTLVQLIFGGYLQSKIICTKCQVSSAQSERILDLTVEIDGDINTLEGALRRFTSSEVLDGDNRYHCSRCMSYERAKKKLMISEAPNILTIALKRYQSGVYGKISKDVKFPEHLNLSQFMCETDDYSPVYSLYAVVVHHDVMNTTISGHYVCYVKDPQGKWHEMDDSKVKPVSLKKVLSKCAYMLLYARCSPRVPDSVRKAMINQGASHAKKPKKMADSESTPLGGGNYVSMHQGGNLCKDRAVHHLTYTSEASDGWSYPIPGFSRSDSSSLFSNSDAGSSSTLSSDSTNSTRNLASMEYDYIFGASDHMHPVSPAVIPEEDELSYLRQRSSFNPCSSGHYMDQGGEFAQQYYHRLQVGGGVLEEGGEKPSFYTDQGKQNSSSNRNRSFSRSCKITEQRRYTGTGAAFFLEGRGLSKHFTGRGGLGL